MGINGLFQFLKPTSKEVSIIKQFRGKRIAVDMYCLLHRGAMADPRAVLNGQGHVPVRKFIERLLSRLTSNGVDLICVFDGQPLPLKSAENEQRSLNRKEARRKLVEGIEKGLDSSQLYSLATQGISISKDLVHSVVDLCIEKRWAFIVAPYEADAQLAYLCREGIVDACLSEDSDLLAYGCPIVLSKVTREAMSIQIDLTEAFKENPSEKDKDGNHEDHSTPGESQIGTGSEQSQSPPLSSSQSEKGKHQVLQSVLSSSFGHSRFLSMCILAGCDYIDRDHHLPGMGLVNAAKHLLKHDDLAGVLSFVSKDSKWPARLEKAQTASLQAISSAHRRAWTCFQEHWVYCPIKNAVIPLNQHLVADDASSSMDMKNIKISKVLSPFWNHLLGHWKAWETGFHGAMRCDPENFDASILGACLDLSSSQWFSHLTASRLSAVLPTLTPIISSSSSSLSASLQPSPSFKSLPPSNIDPSLDLDELLNWDINKRLALPAQPTPGGGFLTRQRRTYRNISKNMSKVDDNKRVIEDYSKDNRNPELKKGQSSLSAFLLPSQQAKKNPKRDQPY